MDLDTASSRPETDGTGIRHRARLEDLEAEALAVLREGGDRGMSYQELVARVLARHLRVGMEQTRAAERSDIGSVADIVADLLVALPQSSGPGPWAAAVGPVFLTEQVRGLLGTQQPVSRQAIADRAARRTLLALRTSDRHTVYPAWQFRDRQVLRGVPAVLQSFVVDGQTVADDWTLASWLRIPLDALGGESVSAVLAAGDTDRAVTVARTTAARWAR